jgi:electron transport complex protein RnfA
MNELVYVIIGVALVNNIVLSTGGQLPFSTRFGQLGSNIEVGVATSTVMVIAAAAIWAISHFVTIPLDSEYMNLVIYVALVVLAARLLLFFVKKAGRAGDDRGVFLALIIADTAVLGTILVNEGAGYSFTKSVLTALSTGAGFVLVLAIVTDISRSIELSDCPRVLKGWPLAFITATCLGLVFYGFSGLKLG